tara:strand:- start:5313 stop:6392 length:1080 start_codon:yes stop_codon:yes gene_type:complete
MADRIVKPDTGNDLVLQNDDASAKIEINEAGTIIHTGTSSIDVSGGTFTTSTAQKQAIVQAGPGSGTIDVSGGTFTTSTAQKTAIVDGGKGNLTKSDVGLSNVTNDTQVPASGGSFTGNVSFSDNNITNVGDISLDTISSDSGTSIDVTLGTDSGDDFNVGSGKLVVEGDTGNVGIGTDSPTSSTGNTLEIYDDNTPTFKLNDGGTFKAYIKLGGNDLEIRGSSGAMEFYNGGNNDGESTTLRLTIASNGNFTGSSSADISDQRFKENIKDLTGSLEKICKLRGISYTWKKEANKDVDVPYYGLLAQELEAVIPDLVWDQSIFDTEKVKYKSIHMSGLIPVLLEAVKELSAKITALESK